MEGIVFITLQMFPQHAQLWKLENITRIFPSFSWDIYSHVKRLGLSRASKKYAMYYIMCFLVTLFKVKIIFSLFDRKKHSYKI